MPSSLPATLSFLAWAVSGALDDPAGRALERDAAPQASDRVILYTYHPRHAAVLPTSLRALDDHFNCAASPRVPVVIIHDHTSEREEARARCRGLALPSNRPRADTYSAIDTRAS